MEAEDLVPNRLATETSPYLRQHQHNPVDWDPWGEEALTRAREEQKPILVSIGYSSCHWCHVMAHESFEHPQIARFMNDHFVNIKVDREERPDIDAIYMSAVQAMSGQGGWPLNVFVTPDGVPFFGGTYWPPRDHAPMPGFPRVLQTLATAWATDRANLLANAQRLGDYLRRASEANPDPGSLTPQLARNAAAAAWKSFDQRWGGFGGAPKFPQPSVLRFLLRHHRREHDPRALTMVRQTLDRMAAGGIHDQLGGGFARYSVDERWHVPHFEKMLYDNAQLLELYADLWTVTGEPRYRHVAAGIVAWAEREMRYEHGGFAAALDADSEGVEGKFYAWSPEEVDAILEPEAADLVKLHYGITSPGSFEGKTVLQVVCPVDELAQHTGKRAAEIVTTLEEARSLLLEARERRVRPGRDDKVIAGWNGLMIRALARSGNACDEPTWVEMASGAATFVMSHMRREDGALARSWNEGQTRGDGVLEDYAAMALGLVALYEATAERSWLDSARELVESTLAHFRHDGGVGFYDISDRAEGLVTRPRELTDGATPSGNGLMAEAMFVFGVIEQNVALTAEATALVEMVAKPMEEHPVFMGQFLSVAERLLTPAQELVFAGDPSSTAVMALRRAAAARHEPFIVTGYADPANADAAEHYPMLAERPAVGEGAAYLCQDFACLPPVTTPEDLIGLMEKPSLKA
jgi:uncharacterized protein YyaL (SSP411 family)